MALAAGQSPSKEPTQVVPLRWTRRACGVFGTDDRRCLRGVPKVETEIIHSLSHFGIGFPYNLDPVRGPRHCRP